MKYARRCRWEKRRPMENVLWFCSTTFYRATRSRNTWIKNAYSKAAKNKRRKEEKNTERTNVQNSLLPNFARSALASRSLSLRKVWLRLPVTHKEMGQIRLLTNGAAGFPFAGEYRTVRGVYIRVQSHGFQATASLARSFAHSLARSLARSRGWIK